MSVSARNLIAVPAGFDLKLAAASSLVYLTAWRNLIEDGGLRPGETVLIIGAGGGVNIASIQLAKLAGATSGSSPVTRKGRESHGDRRRLGARPQRGTRLGPGGVGEERQAGRGRGGGQRGRGHVGQQPAQSGPQGPLADGRRHHRLQAEDAAQSHFWASIAHHRQHDGQHGRRVQNLPPAVRRPNRAGDRQRLAAAKYPQALARMMSGEHFGKIVIKVQA